MSEETHRIDLEYGRKLAGITCRKYLEGRRDVWDRDEYESAANYGLALAVKGYDPQGGCTWRYFVITLVRQQLIKEDRRRYGDCERYQNHFVRPIFLPLEELRYGIRYACRNTVLPTSLDWWVIQRWRDRLVREAVSRLEERERDLIYRRFWEEETLEAIARERGMTKQGVHNHQRVLLRKLAASLQEQGYL